MWCHVRNPPFGTKGDILDKEIKETYTLSINQNGELELTNKNVEIIDKTEDCKNKFDWWSGLNAILITNN